MRILLYDDDLSAITHLEKLIHNFTTKYHKEFLCYACKDKQELFDLVSDYDILFLDIEVYEDNGIDLGLEIRKLHPNLHIIITSSFTKYLVEGYKIEADRYFLKPINAVDFDIEFLTVIKKIENEQAYVLDEKVARKKILFKDIRYVEYLERKTYVHTLDDTKMTSYPFKYWIDKLQDGTFVQIYKSILINMRYIEDYDDSKIILDNNECLPLSRHYKKAFQEVYHRYLQGEF